MALPVPKSGDRPRLRVFVPAELMTWIEREAANRGLTTSSYVRMTFMEKRKAANEHSPTER